MKNVNLRAYLAEFVGTLILVFMGTGCVTVYSSSVAGILGTSLAFGLALASIYYGFGKISGGHVNPAVSIAMYFDGRLSLKDLVFYIISQILGALAGSGLLYAILKSVPKATITTLGLGQNGYGAASAINVGVTGAIITEIVLTCIFVLTVLGATKNERYKNVAGIAIGGALTLVHLLGYSITGTSVNPARSLAPALILKMLGVSTALNQVWVFIAGPVLGSLIAVFLFKVFTSKKEA